MLPHSTASFQLHTYCLHKLTNIALLLDPFFNFFIQLLLVSGLDLTGSGKSEFVILDPDPTLASKMCYNKKVLEKLNFSIFR